MASRIDKQIFRDIRTLLSELSPTRKQVIVELLKALEQQFDNMHEIGYHAGLKENEAKLVELRKIYTQSPKQRLAAMEEKEKKDVGSKVRDGKASGHAVRKGVGKRPVRNKAV